VPDSLIFCSVGPRLWADAADGPNTGLANTRHVNTRLANTGDKFLRLLASFDM
jgi:hypothetical protein